MSNSYPDHFTIEIERERLRTYLRTKYLLSWVLGLGFFGVVFGLASMGEAFDRGIESWQAGVVLVAKSIAIGIGASSLIALFLYFLLSHRLASRFAASIELTVEGAFLRIRQHTIILSDRKLHFRSIVDYAVTQDFLMRRFGLHALQMTTTAGGPTSTINVPSVKDCLRVRDLLADIDQQREHQ
jgi:hypothetical protein